MAAGRKATRGLFMVAGRKATRGPFMAAGQKATRGQFTAAVEPSTTLGREEADRGGPLKMRAPQTGWMF